LHADNIAFAKDLRHWLTRTPPHGSAQQASGCGTNGTNPEVEKGVAGSVFQFFYYIKCFKKNKNLWTGDLRVICLRLYFKFPGFLFFWVAEAENSFKHFNM
jgi:hypothetical protein